MPRLRQWPKDAAPRKVGRPLTRNEVYKIVSRRTGVRQADVDLILDAFMETFVDALRHGDTLSFKGVGKFQHQLTYPGLRWDRQAGAYRVRYYGRRFRFVPAPALAAELDAAFEQEFKTTPQALFAQTGSDFLGRMIATTQQRQATGKRVAADTLPELEAARKAALQREATGERPRGAARWP
jgi:nucleoid DNA-binding protein